MSLSSHGSQAAPQGQGCFLSAWLPKSRGLFANADGLRGVSGRSRTTGRRCVCVGGGWVGGGDPFMSSVAF